MNGRILVATDGTDGSLGALRVARALAERSHGTPIVLSVVEPIVLEGSVLYAMPGQVLALSDEPEAAMRDHVRGQLAMLGGAAEEWEPETAIGPVASTIARLAEERGAGLIVLGFGGHTRAERFLGGETALNVVRLARVPVLAVQPDAPGLPRRAIVAVDFSEYCRDAASTLLDIVGDDAEVRLAHTSWTPTAAGVDAESWIATYDAGVRARLDELAGELRSRSGARVAPEVLEGTPSREILDLAKRTRADVIAAGSHGYGFFTRLLMGSVSTHLLREAPCSVLIAPPRAASDELRQARAGRTEVPAAVAVEAGMASEGAYI